jgi:hypothetical protein
MTNVISESEMPNETSESRMISETSESRMTSETSESTISTYDLLFSRSAWNSRSSIPHKDVSTIKFNSFFLVCRGSFLISADKLISNRVFAIPFFEFAGNGSLHSALHLGSRIYFEPPNAWSKQKYGMELVESIASFIDAFNSNQGGREYLLDNGMLYFLIEDPSIKQKFLNLGFTPVA